jgi:hypothetical protein
MKATIARRPKRIRTTTTAEIRRLRCVVSGSGGIASTPV